MFNTNITSTARYIQYPSPVDTHNRNIISQSENNHLNRTRYSSDIWDQVDRFFDLGSTFDLSFNGFSAEEKEQFYQIIAKLIQKGIVGWNYFEINGQIEKHYIVNQIGDSRTEGKRVIIDRYA